MECLEEDVQKWFRYKDDGTVVVDKRMTEAQYDASKDMPKVCREDGLEDEDLPPCTEKVIGNMCEHVLEDMEARNVFTKNIMSKSKDFLRHVVGETEGAISFTCVCEHRKLFPVERLRRQWSTTP